MVLNNLGKFLTKITFKQNIKFGCITKNLNFVGNNIQERSLNKTFLGSCLINPLKEIKIIKQK